MIKIANESKKKTKSKSHQNRGLKFEAKVQDQCNKYIEQNKAIISKVPTEFKITRGAGGRVVGAFPVTTSKFVDFCGILKGGKGISIECKETQNKTSFPLSNISEYQLELTQKWIDLGGDIYYLVYFKTNEKVFMITGKQLLDTISSLDRKSIPYNWFLDNAIEVENMDFLEKIEN